MTLVFDETRSMELRFKMPDDEEFRITSRFTSPATVELFRTLDAAPAMLDLLERWVAVPYDEYHQQGAMRMEAAELIARTRGDE
jgi:hypothetical protein